MASYLRMQEERRPLCVGTSQIRFRAWGMVHWGLELRFSASSVAHPADNEGLKNHEESAALTPHSESYAPHVPGDFSEVADAEAGGP